MGYASAIHVGRLLLLCAVWARPEAVHAAVRQPPSSPATPSAAIASLVRALDASAVAGHDRAWLGAITRFYADRRFAPAWTDARGITPAGERLAQAIASAADEGLDPRAYPLHRPDTPTPAALARTDVQLSFVALRFAEDLAVGLTVPGAVHRDDAYVRRRINGDSLLRALAGAADADAETDAGRALLEIAPRTVGYVRLREALQRLRTIERAAGWGVMPAGPPLRRGTGGPRVAQLRRLLREHEDLAGDRTSESEGAFDDALAAAVARFQERHGLLVDSVAGRATIAALNVPVGARIEQVRLGMERARWLPPVGGNRWITVNLADYRAFVFDDGRSVFETRVVIGARNHKTPMFVDTVTHIVLNPAWNVPPSIAAKEILPKLRRDPDYLVRNHMVWVGREIQQVPGPWNALGQIAFMFPNRFNVYMHDTPAKELFAFPDRAHSHGCIRVQRPHELAELLLGREGWTRARLDSVIATGRRTVATLETPIPVRITYATAFAGDDGTLHFRPDVYGRDALLGRAMLQERQRPLPTALR
jgi:murein L,D-transpeptidase YcbB/YkuD